ncbi:MAG TPA: HlyD family efflux transporter periplasmic adaptor subunit [Gemmatimonadaceae bacterium]|nr:HlyD family efflux transporter periplasmic adaptor subunit [Gemmatimonadaceae bacterium]
MDIKREPKKNTKKYVLYGLGLAAIAAVTIALVNLEPAAQSVDRQILIIDSVKRGDMVRDVSAPGTLVPERVRIVTALTAGRVEELPLRPGASLIPGTVIVTLVNPDENLLMLQYRQALGTAISAQANLRSSLQQQQMSQENIIAAARTSYNNAVRNAAVLDSLEKRQKGLASRNEIAAAQDALNEARTRMEIEVQRYDEIKRSAAEQIRLNDEQVAMARAILDEQTRRLQSMRVVAPEGGVLQQLGNPQLEYGQYVQQGTELARIAQPGKLKAVLRVPDVQAKDVAVGQSVIIDLHNNTTVKGSVIRYDPAAQGGNVTVEVAILDPLPSGVRAEQTIDGRIVIESLKDVLHVGRPSYGTAPGNVGLWVLSPDGTEATLVPVELGSASVSAVQVKRGLTVGQKVIISDMSSYEDATRIRIKQ